MGMFDTVTCEQPLPDGADSGSLEFQTKDMKFPGLDTYKISRSGRLIGPDGDMDFHGHLNFYGSSGWRQSQGDNSDYEWHEYDAKFTDGQLVEIVTVSAKS